MSVLSQLIIIAYFCNFRNMDKSVLYLIWDKWLTAAKAKYAMYEY